MITLNSKLLDGENTESLAIRIFRDESEVAALCDYRIRNLSLQHLPPGLAIVHQLTGPLPVEPLASRSSLVQSQFEVYRLVVGAVLTPKPAGSTGSGVLWLAMFFPPIVHVSK